MQSISEYLVDTLKFTINYDNTKFLRDATEIPATELDSHTVDSFRVKAVARGWITALEAQKKTIRYLS